MSDNPDRTICGWQIRREEVCSGVGMRETWVAHCPTDKAVTAWIEDGHLVVSDDTQYYPGGGYSIPLPVIVELQFAR